MKFYGDENSLKGERNGEVNSHKPEVAEFVVEENFEQRENDQNDHSNETPARAESEPETESDGPDLTNNENCMFDVVQENEAQAQDHASDAEPEAQIPFHSLNKNTGSLLGVHEGFQNLNIKLI